MKACGFTGIQSYGPFCNVRIDNATVQVLSETSIDYLKCSGCGNYYVAANMQFIRHGLFQNSLICTSCFETLIKCRECGVRKHISEFDGNACFECNSKKVIKNFNCRAQRYLGYLSHNGLNHLVNSKEPLPKTLYYGVELEVQINNPILAREPDSDEARTHRKIIAQHLWRNIGSDFAIMKHDGSVGFGFEIVTAPATFDVQKERWNKFFEWLYIKDEAGVSSNVALFNVNPVTCGMHIHASRAGLSKLLIGKIMSFIYEKNNADFIHKIAQRDANHYSDWNLDKKVTDVLKPTGVKYEALNLNNNKTIEIRIFQAELIKASFFKNLEFFDALIEFCKNASINEARSYRDFIYFINKWQKIYPYLYSFINQHCVTSE